jgi:SpoIID/LytB domain protein
MRARYHRTAEALVVVLAALAALGAQSSQGALGAQGAPGAESARGDTLVIDGAGDGHGVGMSQEGARGYAEHGYSYGQILAHYYTGTALGMAPKHATVKVLLSDGRVRRMGLEGYVRGVVGAEVSASWPMAALEAQAVASRTYALTAHAGGAKFDVYSDTRSQMYLGKRVETPATDAAVRATAGQIVTYGGRPAITYFFASSGGQTESVQNAWTGAAAEPWLVGVRDPYDGGPLHRWTIELSFHDADVRLKGLLNGSFKGIEVLERGSSPRIVSAYVLGSKGRTLVSGAQLQERLGLYDTWAHFSVTSAKGTRSEPDLSEPQESGAGGTMAS